MAQSVAWNV